MQVRLADMSDELQQSAQDIAVLAFQEHTLEKDRAQYIKKEMDRCVGQQATHVDRRCRLSSIDAGPALSTLRARKTMLTMLLPLPCWSYQPFFRSLSHIRVDRQHGQTWHCIVGKNFGSYVTHETGNFIYFYLNSAAIVSGTHRTMSA